MAGARIVVAEADSGGLTSLRGVLRDSGFDVSAADDRDGLYEALYHARPDLLVLDVMVPGSDGVQLLQELKGDVRWRDIPVLMVSSLSPDEITEKSFGLGAADFIRKPFRPRELVARVQAQLRQHRALQTSERSLRSAEEELRRARDDAEARRALVDILHEVTGDLSSEEIYHLVARRVARELGLSRCSVILAKAGDVTGRVAAAFDRPSLRDFVIQLAGYPEIRAALESGKLVLAHDLDTDPLYEAIRKEWSAKGMQVPVRSAIVVPFTLGDVQAGVFFLRRMKDEQPLTEQDAEFAQSVIRTAVAAIRRALVIEATRADNARLEVLALTDPLTQVLNRRALATRLDAEMERARRYESEVTLLMVDIDYFKAINDTYGHLVGDDVLRELAALLTECVRSVDIVARFGGEEFVVVLPETGLTGAVRFAERTTERIESHTFIPAHGGVRLTSSTGVASFPAPGVDTVDDLFARADEALYRAKAAGRNKVCT